MWSEHIPISTSNFWLYRRLSCVLPDRILIFCFIDFNVEKPRQLRNHFKPILQFRHQNTMGRAQMNTTYISERSLWDVGGKVRHGGHTYGMASTYDDALSPPFTDLLHTVISGEETRYKPHLKTAVTVKANKRPWNGHWSHVAKELKLYSPCNIWETSGDFKWVPAMCKS